MLKRSTTDDSDLWDIVLGHFSNHMLLVAHNRKLFPLLAQQPQTLEEVASQLGIALRPTQAMLTAVASMGFIKVDQAHYSLTTFAEEYLLEGSPTYFGGFLDMVTANHAVNTYDSLQKAITDNAAQVYTDGDLFASHQQQAELAKAFTLAMHGHSMAAALEWVELLDLSGHQMLLDVGGGSGAHAIAAVLKWKQLRAVVADLPPVCEVADGVIARHQLQQRITTQPTDMWETPFPDADVHFYADIYHDWPPEKGAFLTAKSFEQLPSGGRIIIHEMLLNANKTGPISVANYNTAMLLWTEGQQYSDIELVQLLKQQGFIEVEIIPSSGYWSLVTGVKP
ncbi:methyltransferase [Leptolyngbya sp. PCC 6406]|uniref:methyltransferase n=1 Tax=Leptolyngbya sp. PCC 6406 TaxID=1173264 RepID=UPI0002AC8F6E|nr:methyltransferase [Leptolyngbya sp. PCC 6406]